MRIHFANRWGHAGARACWGDCSYKTALLHDSGTHIATCTIEPPGSLQRERIPHDTRSTFAFDGNVAWAYAYEPHVRIVHPSLSPRNRATCKGCASTNKHLRTHVSIPHWDCRHCASGRLCRRLSCHWQQKGHVGLFVPRLRVKDRSSPPIDYEDDGCESGHRRCTRAGPRTRAGGDDVGFDRACLRRYRCEVYVSGAQEAVGVGRLVHERNDGRFATTSMIQMLRTPGLHGGLVDYIDILRQSWRLPTRLGCRKARHGQPVKSDSAELGRPDIRHLRSGCRQDLNCGVSARSSTGGRS